MAIKVLALASGVTSLADHRVLNGAMMTSAGQLQVRGGVLPGVGGLDLSTVSAMVARVAPGKVLIPNTVSSALGPYLLVSDANVDITFDAGEASVGRVDRIIARAYDNANDASGQTTGSIYYLKGQPAGTATALPANSVLLYEMTVPQGASAGTGGINFANAVDQRVYTVAQGGMFNVANNTQMTAIASPYEGMMCYRTDLDGVYIYDGSTWRPKTPISVASSANLTSINNPQDGYIATVRDTDYAYQWTGSQWRRCTADFGNMSAVSVYQGSNDSTSSTTYTPGTQCAVTFNAPQSGSVKITFSAMLATQGIVPGTLSRGAYMSVQTRTGSSLGAGTIVQAADDSRAAFVGVHSTSAGFKYMGVTHVSVLTGLTPGAAYNCEVQYKTANAAEQAAQHHRRLLVEPLY